MSIASSFANVFDRTPHFLSCAMQNEFEKLQVPTLKTSAESTELMPSDSVSRANFDDPYMSCKKAVVKIVSKSFYSDHGQKMQRERTGSGAIVKANGEVLTDFHVVSGATEIDVETSTGEHYKAKVVKKDAASDLAKLVITPKKSEQFPFLRMASTNQHDASVCALGIPMNEHHSFVSPARFVEDSTYAKLALRRAVAIAPGAQSMNRTVMVLSSLTLTGESGAPLLDKSGSITGIIDASDGVETAVATPLSDIKRFLYGVG